MRIAVTRAPEDAAAFAAGLEALGCEPVLEPLLHLLFSTAVTVPERDYQAVLVTSANAVRGLEASNLVQRLKSLPVYAVGKSSAAAARVAGFTEIHSADGDLPALHSLVVAALADKTRPLLYAAGLTVSGDLKGMLESDGWQVERLVLYRAEAATVFSSSFASQLEGGRIDAVTLFSPRTARIWAGLANTPALIASVAYIRHFCLSEAVGQAVTSTFTNVDLTVDVSETPDMEAMLAMIASQ